MSAPRMPSISSRFTGAAQAAEVHQNHRLVDQIQGAEPEIVRDRHRVECAVDAETGRDLGFTGDRRQSKIGAPIERDRADGRAGVHAEERRLAVDLRVDEQMILRRANKRERFILESAAVRGAGRRGDCAKKSGLPPRLTNAARLLRTDAGFRR